MTARTWQEPFLVQSGSDEDDCYVTGCKWKDRGRWFVEVVGYYGTKQEYPLDQVPSFVVCSSHLALLLNRFVDVR